LEAVQIVYVQAGLRRVSVDRAVGREALRPFSDDRLCKLAEPFILVSNRREAE
jgi:hypothetical protein